MIHFDTSFLVDVLRETARGEIGPGRLFLETIEEEEIGISLFVACELFAGAEMARDPAHERGRVEQLCASLTLEHPDETFPLHYGRLLAFLENAGQRIATRDLLIATSAIAADAGLVTRNVRHFSRLPGLRVLSY